MKTADVVFTGMAQASQEMRTGDDHLVARVSFIVSIDGKVFPGHSASIKQPAGSDDYENLPLEVSCGGGTLDGWALDVNALSQAAESYYRQCVGSSGSGIKIGAGAKNVQMSNNDMPIRRLAKIPIRKADGTTW